MTAAHLFSLFWSLPWVVRGWIVLVLLLLADSVRTNSRRAGRVAARVDERCRRNSPAERRRRDLARDRHLRAVNRAPQPAFDQVLLAREIEMAGELELRGDDLEEADHARRR